jgi:hypothetical protein
MPRELVREFRSPTGRLRLLVEGTLLLRDEDIGWLEFLARHPTKIHEVLNSPADVPAKKGT